MTHLTKSIGKLVKRLTAGDTSRTESLSVSDRAVLVGTEMLLTENDNTPPVEYGHYRCKSYPDIFAEVVAIDKTGTVDEYVYIHNYPTISGKIIRLTAGEFNHLYTRIAGDT